MRSARRSREGPGLPMRDVLLVEWVDRDGVGGGGMGTTGAGGAFGDLRRCAWEATATSPPGQDGH